MSDWEGHTPEAGEKEHLHLAHSKCTIWRVCWVSSLVWIMAKWKFVYLEGGDEEGHKRCDRWDTRWDPWTCSHGLGPN